jgi:hypothetical protein
MLRSASVLPIFQPAKERRSRVGASEATTRFPLVATLGVEIGILGLTPQVLEGDFLYRP